MLAVPAGFDEEGMKWMADPEASPPAAPRLERWAVPVLFALVVVLWGAAVGFGKIRSFDYWWHLRTGAWILEHGTVPKTDLFSFTRAGARWIDMHWAFQIALSSLQGAAGHEGVRIAKGLLVTGLLAGAGAIGWRRERAVMTGLAVVLLAIVGGSRFLVRPDLVSFALLLAVLALLFRHQDRGGRAVFAIVPLQLLWANVHGLFAVGLAVCAMALVAECLRPWFGSREPLRRPHVVRLAAVLLLSAGASLLNPNGLDGALFPLRQLGMIGSAEQRGLFGQVILELQPSLGLGFVALAPVAALAGLVGLGFALERRRALAFELLLFAAFAFLALSARRNLALFAVVATPLVTRNLGAAWARGLAPSRRAVASAALLAALCIAGAGFARHQLAYAWQPEGASSAALMPDHYPERAVDWIERERPPAPLYHRMADGGYVIARLFPEQRALVDGRLEVYGERAFAELDVVDGGTPEGFARLDATYRFGTALLHHAFLPDERLLAWLWEQPEWRLVFVDEVAAVFVRQSVGGDPARWPAVDPADPALFAASGADRELRPALVRWRRRAQIRTLIALGEPERALQLAEQTLAQQSWPEIATLRDWLRAQPAAR